MRKSEREITSRTEIDTIIRGSDVCRLALAVSNEPYIVPVSFGYDGDSIYFHTADAGKMIDFMAANNRICFEVERNVKLVEHPEKPCKWSFSYESVIGYGGVRELESHEEKTRGLNHIMEHYSGRQWSFDAAALKTTRVWQLSVSSVTGKRAEHKDPS